jgi:adenylosuccinate synthase
MAQTIVALSGAICSGKSDLAERLVDRYGALRWRTHHVLLERLGEGAGRAELQALGDQLDRETSGMWVADALARRLTSADERIVIVDAVRRREQVEGLRSAFGRRVVHIHVTAPPAVLAARYEERRQRAAFAELPSYEDVRENATERDIEALGLDADVVIDTALCSPADVEVRAAAHLRLAARDPGQLVDVIVGGEYGSEGKGNIAYHLGPEYQLLVRVGGPNAGHKVYGPTGEIYTHRLLPSATLTSDAPLLLAPGCVLDVTVLQDEIADCGVDAERLSIDPQAMIISQADIEQETSGASDLVKAIGSTGKGVGAATARRIMGRAHNITLARDVEALRPYIRPAADVLKSAYDAGHRILLEGTQGSALSLYHGAYPYVTSRDTTVPGALAEAGIAPRRVRRVIMVCRTYPIRVESPQGRSSGPMSQEISWDTIAERSGHDAEELKANERGSVSGKLRRVAEFDWDLLRRSAQLNGPTDIALTFADYIHKDNQNARRFEQLSEETIMFIEEVERVAGAPVSLISTRFHTRSVIDRRSW